MFRLKSLPGWVLCFALASAPMSGHHSFAAQYEAKNRFTMTGTIAKIDWINPHSYIYLDVADESGKVTQWSIEGYPPNTLIRTGIKRNMLAVGDKVTIEGCKARDGANVGAGRELTLKSGTKVFWGPSGQ